MSLIARNFAKYGITTALMRTSGGTYDPVTGTTSGSVDTEIPTTMIHKAIDESAIDGTRVLAGDRAYILDAGQVPLMTDKLKIGSEFWNIMDIQETDPSDPDVVYYVRVRK